MKGGETLSSPPLNNDKPIKNNRIKWQKLLTDSFTQSLTSM